jgi:hypothetical protein
MNSSNKSKQNRFYGHCPNRVELQDYVAKILRPALITEVEHKLNNCNEDICLCSEVIEGLELEKIALEIKKNEPDLIAGFDAQKVYQNIKPLLEKTETNQPIPIQKNISRSLSMNYVIGIAASVVLLVVLAWWINSDNQTPLVDKKGNPKIKNEKKSQPTDNQIVKENDLTKKENSKTNENQSKALDNQLAFAENATLETDLSAQARAGEELRIVAPNNNENFSESLKMAWQGSSAKTYEVEVLNNQRERISLQILAKGQTELNLTVKNWQPGLYYWRLSDENDLLYTGKFTVKK